MSQTYILNDAGEPIPEPDFMKWGAWWSNPERRRVAQDEVAGVVVSTVFLGLDHNFSGEGPPLLFETMVYDKATQEFFDGERRYATRE